MAPTSPHRLRRSQRVVMRIPIAVSGESPAGKIKEQTHTLVINAHGALIRIGAQLSKGQALDLENVATSERRPCRVVYVGDRLEGLLELGVEFLEPSPRFWRVYFPSDEAPATPA